MKKETDNKHNTEHILEEIQRFKQERNRLRILLGRIGGKTISRWARWINILLLLLVITSFFLGFICDFISRTLSLEVGVFLISIKIVLMIHIQQKVNHFQFWTLSSIEYRMNELTKSLQDMQEILIKKASSKKTKPPQKGAPSS